jgi:tetratricopeptide (TPR) repeat protein
MGSALSCMGRAQEAEGHVLEALRLSPRDAMIFEWFLVAGSAKALLAEFGEAASWLRKSIDANRNRPLAFFLLAACLAHLGRLDEARREVKAGLAVDPKFTNWSVSRRRPKRQCGLSRPASERDRRHAPSRRSRAMISPSSQDSVALIRAFQEASSYERCGLDSGYLMTEARRQGCARRRSFSSKRVAATFPRPKARRMEGVLRV